MPSKPQQNKKAMIFASYKDFPHGTYPSGSDHGYPPKINPKIGEIFVPSKGQVTEFEEYPALAKKLTEAIEEATPAKLHKVLRTPMRSAGNAATEAAYSLSRAAFILSECVDKNHPLIETATLTTFADFKAAISQLD
jgi:hypothetical protein